MCYEARCSGCGKTTWGGCGRHVASVYRRVPEDRRCLCREWPGVRAGDQPSSAAGGGGGGGGATRGAPLAPYYDDLLEFI
ncbi:hypothetical protein NL676_009889 [Syzygium grande]|nr:hypothetical protein NL676_009889 [Syzygium grande]